MEIIILFNLYMPPVIIIIHTNMYQFFLLVVKLYIEVVKLMYSGISSSSHFFFDHQTGQHTAALSFKRCHNFFIRLFVFWMYF